jgi:hypothetical protein
MARPGAALAADLSVLRTYEDRLQASRALGQGLPPATARRRQMAAIPAAQSQMKQGETRDTHVHSGGGRVWLVRVGLAIGILYSTYVAVFYGWYATFSGPNQESATVVANIWSAVAVVCLGALIASFFRRRASR